MKGEEVQGGCEARGGWSGASTGRAGESGGVGQREGPLETE